MNPNVRVPFSARLYNAHRLTLVALVLVWPGFTCPAFA